MEIELMNAVAHNGGDLQKGGGGCKGGGRWSVGGCSFGFRLLVSMCVCVCASVPEVNT